MSDRNERVSVDSRTELESLFPELSRPGFRPYPARRISSNPRQNRLIARHLANGVPLLTVA